MPKGRGKNGMDRIVEVPFRVMKTAAILTASEIFNEFDLLLANLGARAVAIGSTYEYFRFKTLHAYQYTTFGTGLTVQAGSAASYTGGEHSLAWIDSNAALTGTPSTLDQMVQYEKFKSGNLRSKLALKISKSELAALPYKWYNTASTGASTDALSPGLFIARLYVVNSNSTDQGTLAYRLIVEGVLQFRGMITPALQFGGGSKVPAETKDESDDDEDDKELFDILDEVSVDPYLAVNNPQMEDNRRWKEAYKIYMKRRAGLLKDVCKDKSVGTPAGGGAQGAPASSANPTASKK